MKTNIIYCDYCNWKLVSRDLSNLDLREVCSEGDKKKFKCPSCGRLISSKKIADSQKELDQKMAKDKSVQEYEKWVKNTIEKGVENE